LRDHASEREKLAIVAEYYSNVTGELDKASQAYQQEIESYQREYRAYGNLSLLYSNLGQYEKAAEVTRQGMRLAPDLAIWYVTLPAYTLAMQRFDETRQILHEGQARKVDNYLLHDALYALAFFGADFAAMAEEEKWFAGKPEENFP